MSAWLKPRRTRFDSAGQGHAGKAQADEHLALNQGVAGSRPAAGTKTMQRRKKKADRRKRKIYRAYYGASERVVRAWRRFWWCWWLLTPRQLSLDDFFRRSSPSESWDQIVRRDPCSYCGKRAAKMTVEHVQPVGRHRGKGGPLDNASNKVGACLRCNMRRGSGSLLHYLLSDGLK